MSVPPERTWVTMYPMVDEVADNYTPGADDPLAFGSAGGARKIERT